MTFIKNYNKTVDQFKFMAVATLVFYLSKNYIVLNLTLRECNLKILESGGRIQQN